jgi:hypothetical protein
MKLFFSIILPIVIFLFSCSSSQTLPKLSYDDKFYHSLITERKPDYGDGHPNGCVIMSEFSCALKSGKDSSIIAEIKDAASNEFVVGTLIKIFFGANRNIDTVVVNNKGLAAFSKRNDIAGLGLSAVGYRTIYINLTKKRILK